MPSGMPNRRCALTLIQLLLLLLPNSASAAILTTTEAMMMMIVFRESWPLLQSIIRYTTPAIAAAAKNTVRIKRAIPIFVFFSSSRLTSALRCSAFSCSFFSRFSHSACFSLAPETNGIEAVRRIASSHPAVVLCCIKRSASCRILPYFRTSAKSASNAFPQESQTISPDSITICISPPQMGQTNGFIISSPLLLKH